MKKIALINDLSGFGKCSLTAAIPVISVMGIQACPLPTAVLTSQTGFDSYYCDDYTDRMDYFTKEWSAMDVSFDGIYSGYLAAGAQIEKVRNFLERFQKEGTLYLADPVMGDHGKPYDMFSSELLSGMKQLVKRADVITPNLTELCMLADADYREVISHSTEEDYIDRLRRLCLCLLAQTKKGQTIIVTGIIREKDGVSYVGDLAVSESECFYVENTYCGVGFSGTGDLFASIICGSLVKGLTVRQAVEKATDFLEEAISEAVAMNNQPAHGVNFENYLSKLL